MPQDIFLGHDGQIKRRQQRNANLASMRMSGELQVDRKSCSFIGEVGFVREQNDRLAAGDTSQCFEADRRCR